MPHVKRIQQCCRCTCHRTKRRTTTYPPSNDDDDDDIDSDDNEVAEILAKEERRQALRRATKARYRARHPERVAVQKRHYRARYPEKVAAEKQRYRERYRAKVREANKRYYAKHRAKAREACRRYYAKHREERRAYFKERDQTEHRRAWRAQYRVKRRKTLAEKQRTLEKIKSLGPLKMTIELQDRLKPANISVETYLETFCQSLEVEPQPSFCELLDDSLASTPEEDKDPPCAITITDMDSGDPLDHAACDESSLSSCDMWDDGRGFLDNLLEELSDLPSSSSDDSLYGLLRDMSADEWTSQDSCFDLDDFVT